MTTPYLGSPSSARARFIKKRVYPFDSEVAWLESTGTQWIDTFYILASSNSMRVNIEFTSTAMNAGRNVFGSDDAHGFNIYFQSATTIGFFLNGGYVRSSMPISNNVKNSLNIYVPGSEQAGIITFNEIEYQTTARAYSAGSTHFYLFTQVPLEGRTSKLKIFSCKIWDNEQLVRDFIPVVFTNEQGVSEGAMYDKVSRKLFRNQGAGSFKIGPRVPYEYEVQWLESTGTQWIDTGIHGSEKLVCEMCFSPLETGNDKPLMCADGGSTFSSAYSFMIFGSFRLVMNAQHVDSLGGGIPYLYPTTGKWYCAKMSSDGFQFDVNENLYQLASPGSYTTAYTLPLFGWRRGSNMIGYGKARVSSLRMREDGALVRDFIPVAFINSNNELEGAMYDRVTKQLFKNQGTGAFVIGPKAPYDAEVEWLESTGTQWINTGLKADNTMKVSTRVAWTDVAGYDLEAFGIDNGSTFNGGFNLQVTSNGAVTRFVKGNQYKDAYNHPVKDKFYDIVVGPDGMEIDSTSYEITDTAAFSTNGTLPLFAWRRSGNMTSYGLARIGPTKIWRNNKLMRDFIPVRFTNEDGELEGAMYDKVSQRLFYNWGDGAFAVGPDTSWKNPYVTDGLIAMWDGEWNAGKGQHNSTTSTWIDISDNGRDASLSGTYSWGNNYWHVNSINGSSEDKGIAVWNAQNLGNNQTIEFVIGNVTMQVIVE